MPKVYTIFCTWTLRALGYRLAPRNGCGNSEPTLIEAPQS